MTQQDRLAQHGRTACIAAVFSLATACAGSEAPPPVTPTTALPAASTPSQAPASTSLAPAARLEPSPASSEPAALSEPIDEKAVADATGAEKPERSPDGVVKASFPRKDVDVAVDGWKMPPFMGLTSWVAFTPGRKSVAAAMIMGDLVLFEDEVNPVLSVLLDHGVQVTALHNHFFYDAPHVFFMHVGGEGSVAALGGGVRAAMAKVAEVRKRSPKPARGYGLAALPAKNAIDGAKLEAALGVKGQAKDGMFKATMGRSASEGRHVQGHDGSQRHGELRLQCRQDHGRQHLGRLCRQ
jgi:hypothetical protein